MLPAQTLDDLFNFVQISPRWATAGQIAQDDIPRIKTAGYEVIVNLAVADSARNGEEGFWVISEGLTYVHIPVQWTAPSRADLDFFFAVMEANAHRKIFVHCFANMRVSAFTYLYRRIALDVSHEEAVVDLHKIWAPNPVWQAFIREMLATYE